MNLRASVVFAGVAHTQSASARSRVSVCVHGPLRGRGVPEDRPVLEKTLGLGEICHLL